ncbi:midasin-like [Haliotis rubra]|uniref:midasin-like n=1 Tax=Haliotis rubra TaxID=36100 RepID=UPI001EE574FE|nr:midasin-like [Haliotis rubra]
METGTVETDHTGPGGRKHNGKPRTVRQTTQGGTNPGIRNPGPWRQTTRRNTQRQTTQDRETDQDRRHTRTQETDHTVADHRPHRKETGPHRTRRQDPGHTQQTHTPETGPHTGKQETDQRQTTGQQWTQTGGTQEDRRQTTQETRTQDPGPQRQTTQEKGTVETDPGEDTRTGPTGDRPQETVEGNTQDREGDTTGGNTGPTMGVRQTTLEGRTRRQKDQQWTRRQTRRAEAGQETQDCGDRLQEEKETGTVETDHTGVEGHKDNGPGDRTQEIMWTPGENNGKQTGPDTDHTVEKWKQDWRQTQDRRNGEGQPEDTGGMDRTRKTYQTDRNRKKEIGGNRNTQDRGDRTGMNWETMDT